MASAEPTATSLRDALRDRQHGRDGRDAPRSGAPPPGERSPAAIGSNGLLMRSISTSSIWLMPTMKTFTHQAGDEDPEEVDERRSRRRGERRGDGVEREDRQRRADERVRAPEAPQHAQRPRRRSRGRPCCTASERRPAHRTEATGPVAACRRCSAAYRATGADPPVRRPARLSRRRHGGLLLALHAAAHRASWWSPSWPSAAMRTGGPWGMASLAAHPGGAVRSATLADAWAAPRGLGAARRRCRPPPTSARCASTSARTAASSVAFADPLPWPRRAFGALGPAQAVPGLSQYWHPWLLRARVSGSARIGDAHASTSTARSPTPRRTGARAGMPPAWWWGQAHGFDRADVCVAFAGGRAGAGPPPGHGDGARGGLGDEVRSVVRPLRPLRVAVDDRGWRLRGARPASRSRRTPTAWPRTCCPCRSRTSAGAWTTGRPST